jgi:cyanophycinase
MGLGRTIAGMLATTLLGACAAIPGLPAPDNGARGLYRITGKPGFGSVFMSGSGQEPLALIQAFRDLAGGVDAKIYVAPFAGGMPNANDARLQFQSVGCRNVELLRGEIANDRDAVEKADAIYVVGGQTGAAIDNVAPFKQVLQAAWRRGAAIGGHSAGAMLWGDQLVVSGEGRAALAKGTWAEGGGLTMRSGISLMPGAIIDPHFNERGRFPRLWVASGAAGLLGIGVDEATAAIWHGDGKLSVIGAGSVTLIKRETEGDGDAARVTVLGDGRSLDLADWGVPRPE